MTFLKKRVEDSIKQAKLLAQRVVPAKPLGRRGYVCEWEDRADGVDQCVQTFVYTYRWVYRTFVLEAFGETNGVLGWVQQNGRNHSL
jgi:hypothetical protein